MPKFSLVVPIYNVESYLDECINSLIQQTYRDYEILLIDDGSTDSSGQIADKYSSSFPNTIKVFHNPNMGLGKARNFGLKYCKGDYVFFIDSDDFLDSPTSLEKLALLTENFPELIAFHTSCFDDKTKKKFLDKKTLPVKKEKYYFKHHYFGTSAWSKIARRDFLINNNLLFEEGVSEDIVWTAKILALNPKIIYNYSDSIYCYRLNRNGSITVSPKESNLITWAQILDSLTIVLKSRKDFRLLFFCSAQYYNIFMQFSNIYDSSFKNYNTIIDSFNRNKKICGKSGIKSKLIYLFCIIFGTKNACKFVKKVWYKKGIN